MNCSDCTDKLSAHLDGDLPPSDTRALDAHLATCPACRRELDSLRALVASAAALPNDVAPARDLWPEISAQLASSVSMSLAPVPSRSRASVIFASFAPLAVAACVALLLTLGERLNTTAFPGPAWNVAALAGTPRVHSASLAASGQIFRGQWLETDATARAKVTVGAIGEVTVEPNSRLRLVATSATDHRVELARGTMSAFIWAPPRLFFVNTPSATAVDLGCAYTLAVDDDGNGELHVTSGYVALEHGGRETVIPAGQMCATRRGVGPGTPFAADAPDALRRALTRFDFENAPTALAEILAQARAADAVTLWHLLSRAPVAHRGDVFATLTRDHTPPASVTRAGILAGDATMLATWGDDLGIRSFFPRVK